MTLQAHRQRNIFSTMLLLLNTGQLIKADSHVKKKITPLKLVPINLGMFTSLDQQMYLQVNLGRPDYVDTICTSALPVKATEARSRINSRLQTRKRKSMLLLCAPSLSHYFCPTLLIHNRIQMYIFVGRAEMGIKL